MNKQLIAQIIDYIDISDQALKKLASDNHALMTTARNYQQRLQESFNKLASWGIIDSAEANSLYESMKNNPEKAAEFLTVTTKSPALGRSSDVYGDNQLDAIAKFALGS